MARGMPMAKSKAKSATRADVKARLAASQAKARERSEQFYAQQSSAPRLYTAMDFAQYLRFHAKTKCQTCGFHFGCLAAELESLGSLPADIQPFKVDDGIVDDILDPIIRDAEVLAKAEKEKIAAQTKAAEKKKAQRDRLIEKIGEEKFKALRCCEQRAVRAKHPKAAK